MKKATMQKIIQYSNMRADAIFFYIMYNICKNDFNCFNFHYILSSSLKFQNKLVKHIFTKNDTFCERN